MVETSPCPRCGAPGNGNFCPNCGASRGVTRCAACGHAPESGARFCTRCGLPMNAAAEGSAAAAGAPAWTGPAAASGAPGSGPGAAGRDGTLGWWVAGLALVALILFVAYPVISGFGGGGGAPADPPRAPAMDPSAVDLNTMTPREAADRLYDRVMRAASAGDSAQASMFLPMAIAAYERAQPLDEDGLYHLSALQRTAGDAAAALATAEAALGAAPEHLLALAAAAEATEAVGDSANAREYWARFLDAYDGEIAAGREEYGLHAPLMDEFLARARGAAGG